jgi:hypothetical protein
LQPLPRICAASPDATQALKSLSVEQLMNVEVTPVSLTENPAL